MEILSLRDPSFAKFGKILDFSKEPENPEFEIIIEEKVSPWRIAVLKVLRRAATKLESHPHSMETFEPVKGVGIILINDKKSTEGMKAYILDQPICLNKAVWHEVLTLSDEAYYKITENLDVECEYLYFDKPFTPCMISE